MDSPSTYKKLVWGDRIPVRCFLASIGFLDKFMQCMKKFIVRVIIKCSKFYIHQNHNSPFNKFKS